MSIGVKCALPWLQRLRLRTREIIMSSKIHGSPTLSTEESETSKLLIVSGPCKTQESSTTDLFTYSTVSPLNSEKSQLRMEFVSRLNTIRWILRTSVSPFRLSFTHTKFLDYSQNFHLETQYPRTPTSRIDQTPSPSGKTPLL